MIESLSNAKIKFAMKLKQKKYRQKHQAFLVEGDHLIQEAYKAGLIEQVFTTEAVDYSNIEVQLVHPNVMKRLSELKHTQGIVAICKIPKTRALTDRVLMLDGIQDPGNFGTLIRSAAAFGFKTILIDHTVDPYNEKVIRGSQGAIFYTNIMDTDLLQWIDTHQDYHVIGTNVSEGLNVQTYHQTHKKIALILGNEGSGVRDLLQAKADENIHIPMEETESLNVGVAGSIIMYQLYKER